MDKWKLLSSPDLATEICSPVREKPPAQLYLCSQGLELEQLSHSRSQEEGRGFVTCSLPTVLQRKNVYAPA